MSENKYEVVKGGSICIGFGRPLRFKKGEIWDVITSEVTGPQFRKLNKRGGSTCILNGNCVARIGVEEGKFRKIAATEALFGSHEELIARTGARW